MKTKKSIWSVALSFIFMFALVLGINLTSQSKVVNADVTYDGHITFDVKVDTENSISVPAGYSGAITVTYTVTETTGVDALQLRLGYDHTAFTLDSVSTIDDDQESTSFALGHATHGAEGYLENIVFENVNSNGTAYVLDEEDEDDLIITAVFYLNQPTPATAYTFSLYNVNDEGELGIGYSKAWKIASNAQDPNDPATHNPVKIQFANEAIVYVRGQFTDFTLTGGQKTYDGVAVADSAITLTYGENTPQEVRPALKDIVWFVYDEQIWQESNVSRYQKLESQPVNAGTYYAVAELYANNYYAAYTGYTYDNLYEGYGFDIGEGKVAEYVILPKEVNVNIDNKETAYGDALAVLTYTVDENTPVIGNDDLLVSLSSTANNMVVGTSAITGSAANGNYAVTFTDGTYTVTARNITVIIADKSSVYGAPLAELTYTIDANTSVVGSDELGITLQTTATVNSNVGTYDITGSTTNGNYNVTFRNTSNTSTKAVYTITSQNIALLNYFSGDSVTFDAQSHDLLIVSNEKPNWISYTAENNVQTNAGSYPITVTATISEQDALNYLSSDLIANLTPVQGGYKYLPDVTGTISKATIEFTVDDKGHTYGSSPATLTPATVGINGEVNVTFTVKDGNNNTITLSSTTPVGEYTIIANAASNNYTFDITNGTYTVSKATPVLSLIALDTEYNNHFYFADASITVGNLVLEIDGSSHENDYGFEYRIEIYNANNQKVLNDAWISENYWLDAGEYTAKLVLVGTDNYNGAVYEYISEDGFDTHFTIEKVLVGAPEIEYDGATATWSWEDDTVTDCDDKELHNSTVTYTIGGTEYANGTFTATAKGTYTLVITPSNTNYMVNDVDLNPVYSVTFTEGTHPANTATPSNMPAVQYVFEGEQTTQPATNPSLTGYTFAGWDFDFSDYIIEEMVYDGNLNIPALWTIGQRTMTVVYVHSANNTYVETSKTFNVNYNSNVVIRTSNFIDNAHITDIISQYNLNGMRYTFNGFWNYKITGEDEYIRENVTDIVVNATENFTFVALYNANPIVYDITYYFSFDGAQSTQYTIENAAYGSTINYLHVDSMKWFRVEAWYLDEARTQAAPETMPAHDITVYGALVFNVGKGDVNGDGNIDANDITLYRRWIVGGYEMTVLSNNEELYEASELETEDPSDTVYFIARVADTNAATFESVTLGDGSKDIRDVSTIRMGLVGGYGFSIVEGVDVTGEDLIIVREFEVESATDLLALARSGAKVTLSEDITDATLDAEILNSNKDIIIDLNGHTLTLKSFRVTLAEGNTGKILVTNGRINVADGNGVYLTAVDGSVHLDDVTLYDDNGLFVIQTADHSLHLFNVVRFLKKEIVNNQPVEAPAQVLVVKDSHIVVEEEATITIEKVVVAEIVVNEISNEEEVVPVDENSDAEITVIINSDAVTEIPVEGDKVSYEIATIDQLDNVVANGNYKLVADLDYSTTYTERNARDYDREHKVDLKNITLDLNGHTISTINASVVFGGNGATIKNGTFNLIKKNTDGSFKEGSYALIIDNDVFEYGENGTVTVEDVTCIGGVNVCCATVTLNNVSAQTTPTKFYTVWAEQNAHVTINSGNYVDAQASGKGVLATGKNEEGGATITVNGGTFTANNKVVYSSEANAIQIVGGTFSKDPTAYVAQGYYAEEVNNAYVVKQGISNQAQLLEAAANGGSYKVVADFTLTQQVNIEKDFILDGNNYTITANHTNNDFYVFYVVSEDVLSASFSNLNIVSTGYQVAIMTNLDAEGSLVNVNNVDITCDGECIYSNGFGVVNANNCDFTRNGKYAQGKDDVYYSALTVGYAGTINATNCIVTSDRNGVSTFPSGGTINLTNVDVTVTANDASAIWARNEDYNVSGYEAYCLDSVITINGGNIVGGLKLTDKYTSGNKNYHEPRIVITGGTFDNDPTAYVAEGYYADEENGVYTVGEYTTVSTVAEIAAVRSQGGFYQLGADIIYQGQLSFSADTTINLNGYKLQSVNDSALSAANGATLTINGNGNVEAQEVCVLVVDGSKAVINGGEYTSHDNFVVGTNGSTGRGNNVITINAGTFNGNITTAGYVACGIYVANNDTVVVNGGTFNITNGVGILARSGNTTVAEDVVFNVTGNGESGKVGDSRVVIPSGAVFVIDYAANYPGGTPVLTNNTAYTNTVALVTGTGEGAQGDNGLDD